jgi:hypothetical protein
MGATFPNTIADGPAPAVVGDFASANAWLSAIAGPGGLVAGSEGVQIGRFAWAHPEPSDPNGTARVVHNYGAGAPTGFVHREGQGVFTNPYDGYGMLVPPGAAMTLHIAGDFWVINDGLAACAPGDACYAEMGSGKAMFAAGVAASASAATIGADAGGTFTGSIAGDVLTVSAGAPKIGAVLSGTGGNAIATGTRIVAQLSGTPGGVGTYAVSIGGQEVTSTTITMAYSVFSVLGTVVGKFALGNVLSGAGGGNAVGSGTTIRHWLTGDGGVGSTAVVDAAPVGATTASAIEGTTNVATGWKARSAAPVGGLVKISSWLQPGSV